jgi:hypothetical protein
MRLACLGGLDALALDHGGGRAGLATDTLVIVHHQVMHDRLPNLGIAPRRGPAIDGLMWRKASRRHAPRNADA